MAENPLDPQRTGDLSALGISDRNDPGAEIYGPEEEEAQATAAEEQAEEPVKEAPVPEEPAEEPQEEPTLSQLIELEKEPEEKAEEDRVARLEAEIEKLRKEREEDMRERLRLAEEQVRLKAQSPDPSPEQPTESYLGRPAVQAMLRQIRDENPDQYEQTLIELAKAETREETKSLLGGYEAKLQEIEKKSQEAQRQVATRQVIENTIEGVKAQGGMLAELVDDWHTRREGSFIYQMMMENPAPFVNGDQRGIRDAVYALESRLRHKLSQGSGAGGQSTGVVSSAGSGVASTRGVQMNEKPRQKTPEEEYADRMFNTSRAEKLEFFG